MYKYIEDNLEDPRQGRDALGVITFEYFLKLYKTALIWNRVQFAEKKKLLITQRRKALQNNDMDSFRKCFLDMVSEDVKIHGSGACGKGHKEWVKTADGGPYLKAKGRLG